ncbi:MAG: ASCH domain-containing protein [Acidobacteriota bacterium]|nr:ASCH domain-containing protein [Acidobacteriota bacterium]
MKAITLTQPWASLVAVGAKRIETRSWSTSYRGPIAIHAAKGFPGHAKRLSESQSVRRAFGWRERPQLVTQEWLDYIAAQIKSLPLGCVIATANLVHCIETEMIQRYVQPFTEQERRFGNYEPRRFGFLLENVVALPEPIPAKGALSLWEWTA